MMRRHHGGKCDEECRNGRKLNIQAVRAAQVNQRREEGYASTSVARERTVR